jgi:hypothetical protein
MFFERSTAGLISQTLPRHFSSQTFPATGHKSAGWGDGVGRPRTGGALVREPPDGHGTPRPGAPCSIPPTRMPRPAECRMENMPRERRRCLRTMHQLHYSRMFNACGGTRIRRVGGDASLLRFKVRMSFSPAVGTRTSRSGTCTGRLCRSILGGGPGLRDGDSLAKQLGKRTAGWSSAGPLRLSEA